MGPAGDRVRKTLISLPPPLICAMWSPDGRCPFVFNEDHWGTHRDADCSLFPAHPLNKTTEQNKDRMNLHTWGIGRIRPGVDWNIQTGTTCCLCRTDSTKESWKKNKQLRNLSWIFLFLFSLSKKRVKELLMSKDFQDVESLQWEWGQYLIMALEAHQCPLTIVLEAEWFWVWLKSCIDLGTRARYRGCEWYQCVANIMMGRSGVKTCLSREGSFCKSVLQTSKRYEVAFQGFVCFLRLWDEVGVLLLPLCQQQH